MRVCNEIEEYQTPQLSYVEKDSEGEREGERERE
jgi:hypothetical protein